MLIDLLMNLLNNLGLIVLLAFFLSRTRFIKGFLSKNKMSLRDKIIFSVIFGLVGIIGTYAGVEVNGAIANSRSIGVIVAGLFGGPFVGLFSGLIAGIHRILLPTGKFTALACGLSTILGGVIAGYGRKYVLMVKNKWLFGLFLTVIIEAIQMAMILLISKPFSDALVLVKIIFIPMAIINALGTGAFILLMSEISKETEYNAAKKASLALKIASLTLPLLRLGLNHKTAHQVCTIILENTSLDAVSIADQTQVLAHIDADQNISCYHDEAIKDLSIPRDAYKIANNKSELKDLHVNCQYHSGLFVPLYEKDTMIGSLRIFKSNAYSLTLSDIKMAKGLAYLFSSQIELSQIPNQEALLMKSEIRALQARIHPHFLFNALNTIISFCRTDADKARVLLTKLSDHLRTSFKTNETFIPIDQEIQQTKNYLDIEEARFSNRLQVRYEVDPILDFKIPPLILQPLVENALIHGFKDKSEDCQLVIRVTKQTKNYLIEVQDNGKGILPEKLTTVKANQHTGIGLKNVMDRIQSIYHTSVEVDTGPQGTAIKIYIPKNSANLETIQTIGALQ